MTPRRQRTLTVLAFTLGALALTGTFAWYFLGPIPFDLVQWWAACTAR